ncbi:hypothetical protein GCM10022247_13810 [Allokutzneria multivorans]|uniref:Uncharacterized protein n=1 Tax=Allokutzneria multivorans TaxID=1142134 RepID=A0ABP7RBQ1_9PSEU
MQRHRDTDGAAGNAGEQRDQQQAPNARQGEHLPVRRKGHPTMRLLDPFVLNSFSPFVGGLDLNVGRGPSVKVFTTTTDGNASVEGSGA